MNYELLIIIYLYRIRAGVGVNRIFPDFRVFVKYRHSHIFWTHTLFPDVTDCIIMKTTRWLIDLTPVKLFFAPKSSGGAGSIAAQGQIYMGAPISVVEIHLRGKRAT